MKTLTAKKLIARSPAKLNLTFDIIGKRSDGYHDVETLMQAIELEDELIFQIEPASDFNIQISRVGMGFHDQFPTDDTNLIARAATLFSAQTGKKADVRASVVKRIPIGAGLAGGSANAAATLIALNQYFGEPLDVEELCGIGSALGADVPFCIKGGTHVGRGRGDELEGVDKTKRLSFILVKPRHLSIATGWVYQEHDKFVEKSTSKSKHVKPHLKNSLKFLGLKKKDAETAGFGNVFEPFLFKEYKLLGKLRDKLIAFGCSASHLTGSGPTIFGVVEDREQAYEIRQKLLGDQLTTYPHLQTGDPMKVLDCWVAESVDYGARVVSEKNLEEEEASCQ